VGGGSFGMAQLAHLMHERLTPSRGERPGRPTDPSWVTPLQGAHERCDLPEADGVGEDDEHCRAQGQPDAGLPPNSWRRRSAVWGATNGVGVEELVGDPARGTAGEGDTSEPGGKPRDRD